MSTTSAERMKKWRYSDGKKCPDCGVLISNTAAYCPDHYHQHRRESLSRKVFTCEYCGVVISHNHRFCRKCSAYYRVQRRGTEPVALYRRIQVEGHPNARSMSRVYEHQVVASQHIGRALKPGEEVHHINKNKRDNRPENLMVFASPMEHRVWEWIKDHGMPVPIWDGSAQVVKVPDDSSVA